jgi:uncharacterized protein (DUF1800 family)
MHAGARLLIAVLILFGALAGCKPADGAATYAESGLTAQAAAAHLLARFTYGARPGDVEKMVQRGIDNWLEDQLKGTLPESRLDALLSDTPATLPVGELVARYPTRNQLVTAARRAGVLPKDMNPGTPEGRQAIDKFASDQGIRPLQELVDATYRQKLLRSVYAENQLQELLTEFWFNHFNTAIQDTEARPRILAYERDTIRPRALGKFDALLAATAKSPTMLHYLDNANNRVRPNTAGGSKGSNENYARELLELHTLGLGNYSQQDIEETARVFTGWGVAAYHPLDKDPADAGAAPDGFLYRPSWHDKGEKTVLAEKILPAGISEGERLLSRLAAHPATAKRIAAKFAIRFVSDDPPATLVNKLAAVFQSSGGDTRAMIRALTASREFWQQAKNPQKIKNPLELAASALRATDAPIADTKALPQWLSNMGMPLYGCQIPTGWPDRAEDWITSGTLFSRLNFRLALATGRIAGVGPIATPPPAGKTWQTVLTAPAFELR